METTIIASLFELPTLSVPVGFNNLGLPMGMQIIGKKAYDLKVMSFGKKYESIFNHSNVKPDGFQLIVMDNQNIKSVLNPTLATIRDNKAKWNLPEFRRRGYRDLHKINRYGLLFRSDAVLTLDIDINEEIGKKFLLFKK